MVFIIAIIRSHYIRVQIVITHCMMTVIATLHLVQITTCPCLIIYSHQSKIVTQYKCSHHECKTHYLLHRLAPCLGPSDRPFPLRHLHRFIFLPHHAVEVLVIHFSHILRGQVSLVGPPHRYFSHQIIN